MNSKFRLMPSCSQTPAFGCRSPTSTESASRRNHARRFHHENHRALRRPGAMPHTLRHDEPLARTKRDDATRRHAVRLRFQVNQEASVEHEEELVVVRMLVPMILALHNPNAHDRPVHLDQRLIVPLVADGGDERVERDPRVPRTEYSDALRRGTRTAAARCSKSLALATAVRWKSD